MPHRNTPELQTRRLTLRALRATDSVLMHELFIDPEVVRFSRINPLTFDKASAMLFRWLAPEDDHYWVVQSLDGTGLGVTFLRAVNHSHRAAEIGYILGRPAWNQGIASEIVPAVIRYGFGQLGLCRVEAYVSTGNAASLRVLEKCGFAREGIRRADVFKNGRFENSVLLSILNESLINRLTEKEKT